ncbi:MAG: hypothetical protein JST54_13540 [Deltaproteobacteria bacterium]|nr:hypothetical protein [Deltaproteobacteria bacterium]
MRALALAALFPAMAFAAAPHVGNSLDPGGAFAGGNPPSYPSTTNPEIDFDALRFVSHHSAQVSSVAVGTFGPDVNASNGSRFQVDVRPALTDGGPDLSTSLWNGSFTGADVLNGTGFIAASASGASTAPLTAGQTYFVVVKKTVAGQSYLPLIAPSGSATDPIFGGTDGVSRTLLEGTALIVGGEPVLQGWNDTHTEPAFIVRYAGSDTCPSTTLGSVTEAPVDGMGYASTGSRTLPSDPNIIYAGEAFDPLLIGYPAAVDQRVFAIELPLHFNQGGVATLFLSTVTSHTILGSGNNSDTGEAYLGGAYTWHRAVITDATTSAVDLSAQTDRLFVGAAYSLLQDPAANFTLPTLASTDGTPCANVTRGQFQLGPQHALAAEGALAGNPTTFPDRDIPFRLCTSEILGDGIDQDCSGADETDASQVFNACRDADGDGHGNPADVLVLSKSAWQANVPAGYVADCTDCDDTNPLLTTNCGTTTTTTGTTTTTTTSTSTTTGTTGTTTTTTTSTTSTASSSGSTTASSSGSSASSTTSSSSGSGSGSASTTSGSSASGSGATGSSSSSSASSTGSVAGSSGSASASSASSATGSSSSATGGSTEGSTGGATTGSGVSTGASTGASGTAGAGGSSGKPDTKPANFALSGCGCNGAGGSELAALGLALTALWRGRRRR